MTCAVTVTGVRNTSALICTHLTAAGSNYASSVFEQLATGESSFFALRNGAWASLKRRHRRHVNPASGSSGKAGTGDVRVGQLADGVMTTIVTRKTPVM